MSPLLLRGDCLLVMQALRDESVDSIVTDPPYGIGFMGRAWDVFSPSHVAAMNERRRRKSTERKSERWPDKVSQKSQGGGPSVQYDESATGNRRFQDWTEAWAAEALRVVKPGGHLLCCAGTRTYHRVTSGIEDAGWQVRDCLSWLYGSGFPKSLDVSKAMDRHGGQSIGWFGPWMRKERERRGITQKELAKHFPSKTGGLTGCVANWELGFNLPTPEQFNTLCEVLELPFARIEEAEREVIAQGYRIRGPSTVDICGRSEGEYPITAPATDLAKRWDGWGTALKPGWEPIILARKPLAGTVSQNVAEYGTGALNVDGCRIGSGAKKWETPRGGIWSTDSTAKAELVDNPAGRWPANVVLSHTEDCRLVGSRRVKGSHPGTMRNDGKNASIFGNGSNAKAGENVQPYVGTDGLEEVEAWECSAECPVRMLDEQSGELKSGTAVGGLNRRSNKTANCYGRFIGERTEGDVCYGDMGGASRFYYTAKASRSERNAGLPLGMTNTHPTVKPIAILRWLARLITPPGGIILDPFAGTYTTGCAAELEGFRSILIEREAEYVTIGRYRLAYWSRVAADQPLSLEIA